MTPTITDEEILHTLHKLTVQNEELKKELAASKAKLEIYDGMMRLFRASYYAESDGRLMAPDWHPQELMKRIQSRMEDAKQPKPATGWVKDNGEEMTAEEMANHIKNPANRVG